MLVLALEFSRISTECLDRERQLLQRSRDAHRGIGGARLRPLPRRTARPPPQNGRARSDADSSFTSDLVGDPRAGDQVGCDLGIEPISQCSTG